MQIIADTYFDVVVFFFFWICEKKIRIENGIWIIWFNYIKKSGFDFSMAIIREYRHMNGDQICCDDFGCPNAFASINNSGQRTSICWVFVSQLSSFYGNRDYASSIK